MESIQIKSWGSRLKGKEPAERLYAYCRSLLREDEILFLNMFGVKHVSYGFAYECFGKLYLDAKERGAKIEFQKAKPHIRPVLLKGIRYAALDKSRS